jgi:hypothetical protein
MAVPDRQVLRVTAAQVRMAALPEIVILLVAAALAQTLVVPLVPVRLDRLLSPTPEVHMRDFIILAIGYGSALVTVLGYHGAVLYVEAAKARAAKNVAAAQAAMQSLKV